MKFRYFIYLLPSRWRNLNFNQSISELPAFRRANEDIFLISKLGSYANHCKNLYYMTYCLAMSLCYQLSFVFDN